MLLDERDLPLLDLLLLARGLLDVLPRDLLPLDLPVDVLPLDLLPPCDDDFLADAEPPPDDFDEPLEDRPDPPPDDDLVVPLDDFVAPEDRCEEPLDFCDEPPDLACGDDPLAPLEDPLDEPLPSCPPARRLTPPTTLVATPMPSRPTFFQSVRRLPTGSPRTVERLLSLRGLFIAASLRALRRPAVAGSRGGLQGPPWQNAKTGPIGQ